MQVAFAVQNSNYLSVLFREDDPDDNQQNSVLTNTFKIFSLCAEGMPCELSFELSQLVTDSHRYGNFNKDLEFVAFSQSSPQKDDEMQTLDYFNVTFLTRNGHLYTLCPVLLRQNIMKEEHFSQVQLLINDLIEDQQEEGLDTQLMRLFKMALIEGKTRSESANPAMIGQCIVQVNEQKQKRLVPKLSGPITVAN